MFVKRPPLNDSKMIGSEKRISHKQYSRLSLFIAGKVSFSNQTRLPSCVKCFLVYSNIKLRRILDSCREFHTTIDYTTGSVGKILYRTRHCVVKAIYLCYPLEMLVYIYINDGSRNIDPKKMRFQQLKTRLQLFQTRIL